MSSRFTIRLAAALALIAAGAAQAEIEINHVKAMAGGVTPGDAPGYPVTLTQVASYRLTGNLVVPPGVNGIEMTQPGSTLDLGGHTVSGPQTCIATNGQLSCSSPGGGPRVGIFAGHGVEVRNGNVQGFGTGVNIAYGLVQDVRVAFNNDGIEASMLAQRPASRLSGIHASNNIGAGIRTYSALIERAVLSQNSYGANGAGMLIVDSVITMNRQFGVNSQPFGTKAPNAMKGTVMHENAAGSIYGPVRSLGGNLVDDVPF